MFTCRCWGAIFQALQVQLLPKLLERENTKKAVKKFFKTKNYSYIFGKLLGTASSSKNYNVLFRKSVKKKKSDNYFLTLKSRIWISELDHTGCLTIAETSKVLL